MSMKLTKRGQRIMNWVFLPTLCNGLAYAVISIKIGGDVLGGKIENGTYYLNNHGRFTEVGGWVYLYSIAHGLSALVMFAAVFVTIFYLLNSGDMDL